MTAVSRVPVGPISRHLRRGALIPFLGAGASVVARKSEDGPALPLGTTLARKLAREFGYPEHDGTRDDLARVASYCANVGGSRGDLKESLEDVFSQRLEPGPLHRLLASIEAPLLILTTNYDNLIETAFDEAGRPYELLIYPADEPVNRGSILWRSSKSTTLERHQPERLGIPPSATIIYKMHGSFDYYSHDRNHHFVISEEDYVRYVAEMPLPPAVQARMRGKRFLFLGYGLKDWNFRVMLHQLDPSNAVTSTADANGGQRDDWKSWAIMSGASQSEQQLWSKKKIELYDVDIDNVVEELKNNLG